MGLRGKAWLQDTGGSGQAEYLGHWSGLEEKITQVPIGGILHDQHGHGLGLAAGQSARAIK